MMERPNRDALNRAVDIFRDAMRPFVVGHMRRVCEDGAEEAILSSLNDAAWKAFQRLRRRGEGIEGAIDLNTVPHIINHHWRDVFGSAFEYDRSSLNLIRVIVDARNASSHPGGKDLSVRYVESRLADVAEVLGRIGAEDEKRAVEGIRDGLGGRAEVPPRRLAPPIPPPPDDSQSDDSYWLNMDSTGVVLHKGSCGHVRTSARPPKWKNFSSKESAQESTGRTIQECKDCFQSERIDFEPRDVPEPPPPSGSSYWVYEDKVNSYARVHKETGPCWQSRKSGPINIIENEWHGPYASLGKSLQSARATGRRVLGCKKCKTHYSVFFQPLVHTMTETHGFCHSSTSEDKNYRDFPTGHSGVLYGANFHGPRFYKGKCVAVCVFISNDKQLFDDLKKRKEVIESRLGELDWARLDDGNTKACRISALRRGTIDDDPETLAEIREWMIERLVAFKDVFGPELKKLAS